MVIIGAGAGAIAQRIVCAPTLGWLFGCSTGAGPTPSPSALTDIPVDYLALYTDAAATCPGLDWTLLAAIGKIETNHGRSNLPGVHSGTNSAGAAGPMQFLAPTFTAVIARHQLPAGGASPPSLYNPQDAIYAAAYLLCDDHVTTDPNAAIWDYYAGVVVMPTSAGEAVPGSETGAGSVGITPAGQAYVARVLAVADSYRQDFVPAATDGAGDIAAGWAVSQVGVPYAWGGETPGVAFDCSGLTQAAFEVARISLPRVAQDQFDAGPRVQADAGLLPGDLVFFGQGPAHVTHVGLYLGVRDGRPVMVDAPHRGAAVRVEAFPTTVGAAWGEDIYLGATRPAG
jgi:cell wall-associated NlpC family hydrolase